MGKKSRKKAAKKHAQRLLPKPVEASTAVRAPEFAAAAQTMFSDSALMETCRTQWQYGEWEALLQIDDRAIEADRDRAKLAALLASVHGHAGNPVKARQLADRAIGWGCSREILARLMISAAINTLGRATMAVGEAEASERHFRESIALVEPKAATHLLGNTRQIREAVDLGLSTDALRLVAETLHPSSRTRPGLDMDVVTLAATAALASMSDQKPPSQPLSVALPPEAVPQEALNNPGFSIAAFGAFGRGEGPSLYIETKSLPRSGLHYLRNSLSDILGRNFSFCEWYTEPGCCQRFPCSMAPTDGDGDFRVRLVKSHDFDHSDPIYPLQPRMRRLVLIRDPLFVLTSWWSLAVLDRNSSLLERNGINTKSINHRHEPSIVSRAHAIVASHGVVPGQSDLKDFLKNKAEYIDKFVKKWAETDLIRSGLVSLVRYAEIPQLAIDLLADLEDQMPPLVRLRYSHFKLSAQQEFKQRSDPFTARSASLRDFLRANQDLFINAANELRENDTTGALSES